MAIKLFTSLTGKAFSPLLTPTDDQAVTLNCHKISLRGALICGGTALVSFIFNRFLAQEGALKALAPHVLKASLYSCATFVFFAKCINRKICNTVSHYVKVGKDDPVYDKKFNNSMSSVAKGFALVGLMETAAAFAFKFVAPNSLISSLAERSLSPLLGLGTAGSVLFVFLNRQQALMGKKNS